jgi:glycogen debranching enzyme
MSDDSERTPRRQPSRKRDQVHEDAAVPTPWAVVGPHLLQDTEACTSSIADSVVLKEGELFILSQPGGGIPLAGTHGFGLYYHDCRYLSGFEMHIADIQPDVLVSSTSQGYMAVSQLTTPDFVTPAGQFIPKDQLGVKRERVIAGDRLAVYDLTTFHNYGVNPITFPVSLRFDAQFEDIFAVRGMPANLRGRRREPTWENGVLRFAYDGSDKLLRRLDVHFAPAPTTTDGTTVHFRIRIPPRATRRLLITLAVDESVLFDEVLGNGAPPVSLQSIQAVLRRSSDQWMAGETQILSNSLALNAIIDRSLRDLRVLRSHIGSHEFFAAGVPWFAALFGRDSLITAIQTLAFNPRIAEDTLRLLARFQGQQVDEWKDEEPGKILHELRVGEMAKTGEIPHTPYYGTIDATPLFLALIGMHANWTGDLTLFNELRPNVERALEWLTRYGDLDGDGYVEYARRSDKGLDNQGWRDSRDGVPNVDGSLAVPPIALVEVQGYVYLAKIYIARLYRRVGDVARADSLELEAAQLRARFNQGFWLADRGHYALALQADKRPVSVLSSNAGHALWARIAEPDKAAQTVQRLMAPDMFSGWGIRTLSEREVSYNPTGYHTGTVWPHDNSLIAAGFRRYGFDDAALRIFRAVIELAMNFPEHRLPELFMGFARDEFGVPVSYPVACRPQAWAAGSVPYLVRTLLGLRAEAFDHRLRIVRPLLPDFVQFLEVRRLRVGSASLDLRFERTGTGNVAVDVLKVSGDLDVAMDLRGDGFRS